MNSAAVGQSIDDHREQEGTDGRSNWLLFSKVPSCICRRLEITFYRLQISMKTIVQLLTLTCGCRLCQTTSRLHVSVGWAVCHISGCVVEIKQFLSLSGV